MYNHGMKRRTISIDDDVWAIAMASGNASKYISEAVLTHDLAQLRVEAARLADISETTGDGPQWRSDALLREQDAA
jgi:hypothetical protein